MSALPAVDVAVVAWGAPAGAAAAARAFARSDGVRARVVVAESPSTPAAREELAVALAGGPARHLALEENRGFGAAADAALLGSHAPYVCVANADVEPAADVLARLVARLADPRVGLAGPRFADDAGGYHADLPRAWALLGRPLVGGLGTRRRGAGPGELAWVEQPAGALLVARRATWEALGGFDPSFFLWYEDVDLARRALGLGLRNVVDGDAVARHVAGESVARLDAATTQAIRLRSLRRYAELHHPRLLGLLDPVLVLAALVRLGSGAAARRRRRELLAGPADRRWRRVIRPDSAP